MLHAFFAALQPAELDLYAQVTREHRASTDRNTRAQAQQVERLRYEAALAARQFRRVDPDNRLVAAELERRWEEALRAVHRAEAAQEALVGAPPTPLLDPALRAALADLGQRLPAIWQIGLLSREQQKALLRCLIEKVVVERVQRACVHTRIVWRGGDTSTFDVPVAVGAFSMLTVAAEMDAQILALIRQGRSDAEIATQLTAAGFRSPRRLVVIESTVRNRRLKHRLHRPYPATHPQRPSGYLTIRALANQLAVPEQWIYARIRYRQIEVARDPATKLYLFPDHPDTLVHLQQLKTGMVQHVRLYREQHDA